jgi:hypothetical protein
VTIADALQDVTWWLKEQPNGMDLYWCPHCGYRITNRYDRHDLINYCWGECLEFYGEPIPITFVRGVGPGRPISGCPF